MESVQITEKLYQLKKQEKAINREIKPLNQEVKPINRNLKPLKNSQPGNQTKKSNQSTEK